LNLDQLPIQKYFYSSFKKNLIKFIPEKEQKKNRIEMSKFSAKSFKIHEDEMKRD